MAQKIPNWLQFLVLMIVGSVLLWLAFRAQPLGEIADRLADAKWKWIAASLALTLIGHLSRARRWQLLIRSSGHGAKWMACFVAMMTGYLSNLGIPRVGEVSRCASLNRLSDVPIFALGGTVVAERSVDLLTFGCLFALTIAMAGNGAATFFSENLLMPVRAFLGWKLAAALLLAAIAISFLGWLAYSKRKQDTQSLIGKMQRWANQIWEGLVAALRMKNAMLLEFLLHTVAIWLSYYAAPLCTMLALGIDDSSLMVTAFYVFVFGSLARTIPLPAGSAGAYHFIVSQWLVFVGYSSIQAITVPTLNHAIQTVFYLIFGAAGLLGFLVMLRAKTRMDPKSRDLHSHPK